MCAHGAGLIMLCEGLSHALLTLYDNGVYSEAFAFPTKILIEV